MEVFHISLIWRKILEIDPFYFLFHKTMMGILIMVILKQSPQKTGSFSSLNQFHLPQGPFFWEDPSCLTPRIPCLALRLQIPRLYDPLDMHDAKKAIKDITERGLVWFLWMKKSSKLCMFQMDEVLQICTYNMFFLVYMYRCNVRSCHCHVMLY